MQLSPSPWNHTCFPTNWRCSARKLSLTMSTTTAQNPQVCTPALKISTALWCPILRHNGTSHVFEHGGDFGWVAENHFGVRTCNHSVSPTPGRAKQHPAKAAPVRGILNRAWTALCTETLSSSPGNHGGSGRLWQFRSPSWLLANHTDLTVACFPDSKPARGTLLSARWKWYEPKSLSPSP